MFLRANHAYHLFGIVPCLMEDMPPVIPVSLKLNHFQHLTEPQEIYNGIIISIIQGLISAYKDIQSAERMVRIHQGIQALTTPAVLLLQDYFDRWGIEVNHRDEKEILGVGQAQVWNEHSVSKVPALLVAMYSWLLLGGLASYGPRRTADYLPLPKWRRGAKRPSCQDLVTLLRQQLGQKPTTFATAAAPPNYPAMVATAAA
jgi:hypothetical protein